MGGTVDRIIQQVTRGPGPGYQGCLKDGGRRGLEPAVATAVAAIAATAVAAIAATIAAAATTAAAAIAVVAVSAAPVVARGAAATTGIFAVVTASVLGGAATATTTATAAGSTATVGRLAGQGLEPAGDLLVGLLEELEQVADNTLVATVQESGSDTSVTSTTGTTDSVDIVVNVSGQVVADDVGDVGDIQTTSSDGSGNHDRAASRTEHVEGTLTLALGAVSVDRGGREVLAQQEVGQRIGHALGLDENQGQAQVALGLGVEDVEKNGTLVLILNVFDLLSNVLRGGTDTADGQEDVVLQEIASQVLDVAGEGSREHESVALVDAGHVLLLDQTSDLGLETHVQHAISLIQDKVLNVGEGDTATLDQVDKTTRSGSQHIASTVDSAELLANIGTTIDDAGADPGAVRELAGLFPDLRSQLAGGGENEGGGVGLAGATHTGALGERSGATLKELGENGEEETTSLSGTSLGTSHQVTVVTDNGDGVLLHGSRLGVLGELNVLEEKGVQRRAGESEDGIGDVVAGGLDGDVVVLFKVDTGALALLVFSTVQLTLQARVAGSGNLDSVLESADIAIKARVAGGGAVVATTAIAAGRGALVPSSGLAGRVGLGGSIVPATVVSALGSTTPAAASVAVVVGAGGSIPAKTIRLRIQHK